MLQLYQQEEGSVPVFLPGQAEICRLQEQLTGKRMRILLSARCTAHFP